MRYWALVLFPDDYQLRIETCGDARSDILYRYLGTNFVHFVDLESSINQTQVVVPFYTSPRP